MEKLQRCPVCGNALVVRIARWRKVSKQTRAKARRVVPANGRRKVARDARIAKEDAAARGGLAGDGGSTS